MLAYFLKVNVAIALFYAFYRLFFYKDTFFGWRRTALMGFFAVAAAVPLLDIQTWVVEQEPMVAMAELYAQVVWPELTIEATPSTTDWRSLVEEAICIVYWGVAALLALRFAVQLAAIIRLACRCRKTVMKGVPVYLLPREEGPFSFFRWIFIHPSLHTEEELDEILIHEQTHARQWHSLDVILGEAACILCWFNPFVWLIKREIRTNLEYMADARVLEKGYDSKVYQYHLLGLSHQKAAATIYNSFNVLPLKKRIKMMNKKRTKEIGRTKYLMFLPLAALLMLVSNIETVARTTKQMATEVLKAVEATNAQPATEVQTPQAVPQPEQDAPLITFKGKVVDKGGKPMKGVKVFADRKYMKTAIVTQADGRFEFKVPKEAVILFSYKIEGREMTKAFGAENILNKDPENWTVIVDDLWKEGIQGEDPGTPDNPVYEVVEQMPEFPGGGMAGLMEYFRDHIQYPEAAKKAGVQGRVTVQFVVKKDGSINDAKILRGIHSELDKEAIRIVSTMPKWKPGTQRGEPVDVKYTVPILFKLPAENAPAKQAATGSQGAGATAKSSAAAKNSTPTAINVYEVVESMPEFPGGMPAMMTFISNNIRYPEAAKKAGVQGRVTVQFVVKKDGSIADIKPLRGIHPELDKEAMRVVGTMPKWKPGTQKGEPVDVKFTVPVMFKLP